MAHLWRKSCLAYFGNPSPGSFLCFFTPTEKGPESSHDRIIWAILNLVKTYSAGSLVTTISTFLSIYASYMYVNIYIYMYIHTYSCRFCILETTMTWSMYIYIYIQIHFIQKTSTLAGPGNFNPTYNPTHHPLWWNRGTLSRCLCRSHKCSASVDWDLSPSRVFKSFVFFEKVSSTWGCFFSFLFLFGEVLSLKVTRHGVFVFLWFFTLEDFLKRLELFIGFMEIPDGALKIQGSWKILRVWALKMAGAPND